MLRVVISVLFAATCFASPYKQEIIHKWTRVDYEWPNAKDREQAIKNDSFIPDNNALAGIKVYDGRIFVTVPRWKLGVPSTLNVLPPNASLSSPPLIPWPSWQMQQIGNCSAFQYVQSMEILPKEKEMWIIDVGRVDIFGPSPQNLCPAKLAILDLDSGRVKLSYEFPDSVVPRTKNFLNDIVIDPVNRIAYITDTRTPGLVVFNAKTKQSHSIFHESMKATLTKIEINEKLFENSTPIDGIALSPDFSTLFYCPLAATELYSIRTSILNDPTITKEKFEEHYKKVGDKKFPTDGMIMGQESLYYGALDHSAVYRWKIKQDIETSGANSFWNVSIKTKKLLRSQEGSIDWPDTFAMDSEGNLYFITNRLNQFFQGIMNFSDVNFRVLKVRVGEKSYLANYTITSGGDSSFHISSTFFTVLFCVLALTY